MADLANGRFGKWQNRQMIELADSGIGKGWRPDIDLDQTERRRWGCRVPIRA
jgi:hypothetical protein